MVGLASQVGESRQIGEIPRMQETLIDRRREPGGPCTGVGWRSYKAAPRTPGYLMTFHRILIYADEIQRFLSWLTGLQSQFDARLLSSGGSVVDNMELKNTNV